MSISLFKVTGGENKATAALAVNFTDAIVATKVIAGSAYLGTKGSTNIGGVCVDNSGNIYVSDVSKHIILKISEGGQVKTVAGLANTSGRNGTTTVASTAARFNAPRGLACDKSGNIYVADTGNNQIRIIRGDRVGVIAGQGDGSSGFVDGVGGVASFNSPYDVAVDASNNIYVADRANHSIRKIVKGGSVMTWAGSTSGDGENVAITTAALFNAPESVDVDAAGVVYVADTGNDNIKKIVPRGWVYLHSGSTDGKAKGTTPFTAQYKNIKGIAVDSAGRLYVVDRNDAAGGRLLKLDQNGKASVMADFSGSSSYDAGLLAVAVSPAGKVFVATDAT